MEPFPRRTYITRVHCWRVLYPDDPRSYKEAVEQDPNSEQVLTCIREFDEKHRDYIDRRLRFKREHPEAYRAQVGNYGILLGYPDTSSDEETDFESSSSSDDNSDDSLDEEELIAMAEFEEATRRYEAEKRRFFEQYPHLQGRFH